MFEKLKSLRANVTVGAVLCIILGIFCIAKPYSVVMTVTTVVGIIFIIAGIVAAVTSLVGDEKRPLGVVLGIVLIIVGAFILSHKYSAASFFPVLTGIILIISSVEDFSLTTAGRAAAAPFWQGIMISAIAKLVIGIISIVCAFTITKISTIFLGIFLLADGISSIFVVHKVNSAEGVFDSTISSEKDL